MIDVKISKQIEEVKKDYPLIKRWNQRDLNHYGDLIVIFTSPRTGLCLVDKVYRKDDNSPYYNNRTGKVKTGWSEEDFYIYENELIIKNK